MLNFSRLSGLDKAKAGALFALAMMGGLTGCEKAAEGQVVAVVNGDEITMQELNAELGQMQLAEGTATQEARNRALDNIVTRHLLANLARDGGIENDPEYILRSQQLNEALLVQMLASKTAQDVGEPTQAEIQKFVAGNPQMFADRAILTVDQIRFPTPARDNYIAALRPAQSMAEVVATLNRLGIRFERGTGQIDTSSVPEEMYRQINRVGSDEPFVIPGPNGVTVSQIVSSRQAPVPADQVNLTAANLLRQTNVAQQLDSEIKAAKAAAEISYQDGFGAPDAATTSRTREVLEKSGERTPGTP